MPKAYMIKQKNFQKAPTAEQRKAFAAIGHPFEGTRSCPSLRLMLNRIEAHLKLSQLLQDPTKRALFESWRRARNTERRRRREARQRAVAPVVEAVEVVNVVTTDNTSSPEQEAPTNAPF
jgi:ribosomal protein L4